MVVGALLLAFFSIALLPSVGNSFHQRAAFASSDPISTGIWQQDQYDSLIVQYANTYGLNPFLVKGQIMLESDFDTWAISQIANAGCNWTRDEGLMQINPYCSATGSANLFDPATNIQLGTNIMASLYSRFGNYDLALQAYNIGANAVGNGQRNWAYSNQVDAYAQQFEKEHASQGGGAGSQVIYIVQSGDTLYLIGQRFGVSWQSIAAANAIHSPYLIYVGEKLLIPGASVSHYAVQPGDTLYTIGQRYGVSWQSIASANGIYARYTIYAGEMLVIP
jgi:LysM repeat protein